MRLRYRFFLLFTGIFLFLFCKCSFNNFSGVETTNGKIIATLFTIDGSPASYCVVKLIPSAYNSVKDSALPADHIDTTNADGICIFKVKKYGTYNLEAVHIVNRTRSLTQKIEAGVNNVYVSDTLQQHGALKIYLPATVDTTKGFIYIAGTTINKRLNTGLSVDTNGRKYAYIDSIPPATYLKLYYEGYSDTTNMLICGALTIHSNETEEITITDLIIKPLWTFRILAGLSEKTFKYYNNDTDSVIILINGMLQRINNNFNDSAVFNGVIKFQVDSIYIFNTSPVTDEFKKPPEKYAFRLIFDAYGNQNNGGWYDKVLTVYHTVNIQNGEELFGDWPSDDVTWAFGLARDGILSFNVDSINNPVNHKAYLNEKSIMNTPHISKHWDRYHINVINWHKDSSIYTGSVTTIAFPSSIGISVESAAGNPVMGASIYVYQTKWEDNSVFLPAMFSGLTDNKGEFIFNKNPFKSDTSSSVDYPNFLILAINGKDTIYSWLPVTELGNAWFDDHNVVYRKKLTFK